MPPRRPRVLLSVAMSLDGFIDDRTAGRLILSNAADLDRVDGVRAEVDAILVGAGTVRADDPRLAVRSAQRRADRLAAGRSATPLPVVLSRSGDLPALAQLFTRTGTDPELPRPLVYTADRAVPATLARLAGAGAVIGAGDPPALPAILADLAGRGVASLLVEGGGTVHAGFLAAGLVDELQVAVAPFLVGDPGAPRFVGAGRFPPAAAHLTLVEIRSMGDVVLLRYRPPAPSAAVTSATRQ